MGRVAERIRLDDFELGITVGTGMGTQRQKKGKEKADRYLRFLC